MTEDPTDKTCPVCQCRQDEESFFIYKVRGGYTLHPATAFRVDAHSFTKREYHIFGGAPTRVFPTLKEVFEFLCATWKIAPEERPQL